MKKLLLFFVVFLNLHFVISQTFEVSAIKNSGDADKRINLVILSDGYQTNELSQFEVDATNFMNDMFSQEPFMNYENYFNVYIIKVPSNESGASHPGTATDEPVAPNPIVPTLSVDNYFGTAYDSFGIHRLLYTSSTGLISTVLANNFPQYDQALILVNSPYYGGSGGPFPIASTGADAGEIAIHELGHSFAYLKDEYYPGDIQVAEAANMTQETDPTLIKWKNWLGINEVGIFPYASSGTASTWNRPHQNCKMRYLGVDFCSVCREGIIEIIHDLISPIDSFTPTETTLSEVSFPLSFQLNTIPTLPTNTLEHIWTLNGTTFATNVNAISIEESDLISDTNNVTVVVNDASPLVNIDNHETIHVSTISWNIVNTLDIIDVKTNNFSLKMYPNPTDAILNVEIENVLNEAVLIEIVGLDGKLIKSTMVSKNEALDVSALSNGFYIANFYVNAVLIGSKKLIKN